MRIAEHALDLSIQAGLNSNHWVFAYRVAIFTMNRFPTKTFPFQISYVLLYKKSPNFSFLKTFGCLCFPCLRPQAKHKLEPRSLTCISIGYAPQQ